MAPEQVRGEAADARSDLFALGAVLYELVSGRRAFERPTAAETMTAVLREDPPPLPSTISPELERIVHHAIEKTPADRFQSARDFSFALQALSESRTSSAEAVAAQAARNRTSNGRNWVAWGVAALASATAMALLLAHPTAPSTTAASEIFAVSVPWNDSAAASPAVSPDGTRIAFIASGSAGDAIWIRQLDRVKSQPLNGTANVRRGTLFWSPDGRSLGFFAGGKLKTVDVDSGKISDIADAPTGYGGSWGTDGTIIFSPDERGPILRVNAAGGTVAPVTALNPAGHEQAHRWPAFLPDGRHFVFMTWDSGVTTRNIQLGSVDRTPSKTLFGARSAAIVGGNYLLYVLEPPSRLMAQAFDPRTLQLEGRPASIVPDDNIDFDWFPGSPGASASAGVLVYTTGKFRPSQLTWFNRTGRAAGTLGEAGVYYDPMISPDGATLAVERRDAERGTTDLWTVDLARGAFSRLTSTPGFESVATWSPDGRRLAFASDQTVSARLLVKNANGTGAEDVLVEGRSFATDWSSDGRYVLYMADGGSTRTDIWAYDVTRKTVSAVLASPFNETRAKFSPDGKWIAYVSDESREPQVYVQSFPDGAQKVQISTSGGDQPEWRRDGKEIFYLAPEPDSMLMAAELHPIGAQLTVAPPQPLFPTYVEQYRVIRNDYTASADGQKFLVMSPVGARNVSPLVAVLNWAGGLSQGQH
jgi:Tol biopolymer transport system component